MSFRFTKLLQAIRAGNSTPSVPSFYFNFSNPQNVTLGAAQARGTITSTQNAVIAASVSPSRTTGVAPLYVNFDATATTSTLITDADPVIQTARRNQELFYATDFGDSGAGVWANGVQSSGLTSKNAGYGPVTGHVYETPGTYTVQMVVTDGVNTATKTGTIVVQDPNTVYAGALTICISHSNNFTGAPSGATQVNTAGNTDMYAALNGIATKSNKRILFCKADSWTCSAQIVFNNLSNMTIGGYGTGVAATIGTGTMVSVTPTSFSNSEAGTSMFLTGSGCSDLSIRNIRINSVPTVFCASVDSTISGMMYYKVEIRGCAQGWNVKASVGTTSVVPDQVCLYECLTDNMYGYSGVDLPNASASGALGTPSIFTSTAHPFKVNYKVRLTGTPPAPLATGTDYWITSTNFTANSFTLSSSYANATTGVSLALSGTGTCTVTAQPRGGDVGVYVALTRGGIMGGYFDQCNHGEQCMRLPYLDRAHVTNNYIARPNQQKNALKIHSVIHKDFPVWTEKFVVSGNVIDYQGGFSYDLTATPPVTETGMYHIEIGSGGNGAVGGEWGRNGIVENNFAIGCLGNPKSALIFAHIAWPTMTVRNNIADFSVGNRSSPQSTTYAFTVMGMVLIDAGGAQTIYTGPVDVTAGIRIYNNTLYSNLTNPNACQFVRTSGVCDDIKIKNNLWYLPNRLEDFQYGIVYNNGGLATNIDTGTAANNTASHLANPNFAVQPPVALADWRPTSGYAVSGGATIPVVTDFNQSTRTVASLGAVKP